MLDDPMNKSHPLAIAHCAIYEKYRESLIYSNLKNDTLDMDRFILTDREDDKFSKRNEFV